jgi:hypothetical protein
MSQVKRLIIFFFAFPSIVSAAPASLQKDSSFFTTRAILLKEHWKPINVHAHDEYALMGVEHELARSGIKEFDSCSIDNSSCVMRYKRGSECLTVFTVGEKIKYMKIVDWNDECSTVSSSENRKTRP